MSKSAILFLAGTLALAGSARAGADVDLRITRYSKVVTAEGVTREARYEETMLRRAGHVWTARVLPGTGHGHGHGHEDEHGHGHGNDTAHGQGKAAVAHKVAARKSVGHKHFNPVTLPRHVAMDGGRLQLTYVDAHAKEVIAIPPGEFDNVGFDGSWDHAYHLLDTGGLRAMAASKRPSPVPGARWRERERDGLYERVLWDEKKQLPLVIESGDRAGTFYNRTELKVAAGLTQDLPWRNLKGYAQREYADFLD
ncbi:hypothetical protein [Pseudoduganella umbonata]|uniref:Uncharacterized protein n=1 Tax=Pseudoduganella umbonata TaxID=864828 RepID=A0A4P8HQE0_9BURK|nr:hypothetical protein [Pseudoduganella umbonata]MBB3222723.1 hypothetical protein [Pseudoduganella umbonata]QCP10782.1 hypothetical protein FCL38_10320 [Pseudoduganella umbonata]